MKKWKQLVVFVMILTMVMGMTSFAAGTGTDGNTATEATDVTKPDATKPNAGEEDDNQGGNGGIIDSSGPNAGTGNVTGTIEKEAAPAATVDTKTAVVGGKEVEVELVVKTFDLANSDSKLKEKIETKLMAQAAELTGFKASPQNKTLLFDVDLQIKGGGTVGTSLDQTVAVSINCGSRFPAGTTRDNLRVLHYSWSKDTWEKRNILSYVDGVVTAEFDSFSPVAIAYSDIPVVDEDSKLTATKDAWKLTSGTQKNKYNVITLNWNKLGSKKDKYELGFFNSLDDVNPYRIVTTKKGNYKFTKAVCGNEYFFKVRVKGSSVWSDACYAYTTLEGKGAPQITSVKTTYNTITIKWKKVTGAKSYNIYDSPSAETPIATVKGNKVTFKNVKTGLSFQYFVRPVREKSIGDVSVAATGTTALQAVTGVKVKGLDSATVKVTWKKVKGATSYIVERWEEPWSDGEYSEPGYWEVISSSKTPVTSNFFVDNGQYLYYSEGNEEVSFYGLASNNTYKYRITAVRDGSYSKSGEGQGKTKNVPK